MSKHTPGPWIASSHRHILTPDHGIICPVYSWMGIEEAEANARLIAAAPDLFEAAVSVVCSIPLQAENSPSEAMKYHLRCLEELRQAIRRAGP